MSETLERISKLNEKVANFDGKSKEKEENNVEE